MGNWKNRRSRRFFYHQYRDPASSYYDSYRPPPPLPDFTEDGIPLWEKRFCSLIGSVPWQKIVNVKEFIFCHDNVANWDDFAGKEAFQSAKQRFWAEINGLPPEHSLPDPDMYIDEINWNPNIDRELIKDLEQAFFVPEGDEDHELECKSKNKNTCNFVSAPSEEWNRNPDEIRAPAECNNNVPNSVELENKSQGWNQWANSTDNSRNMNNSDNPWERCVNLGNEAVKGNTWGDCSSRGKLQGWNQSGKNVNQLKDWNNCTLNNDDNPWEQSFSQKNKSELDHPWNRINPSKDWDTRSNPWKRSSWDSDPVNEKAWGNLGHSYWRNDQLDTRKMNNGGNKWERNFQRNRGSPNDGQWRGSGRGRNGSSWRRSEDQYREPQDSGSSNWGTWTGIHRKREGGHQYATGNKHSRLGESNYQTGPQWR